MDDKKSLVIIGFLIAIIIVLASFFLFLVSSGNSGSTPNYQVAGETQETIISEPVSLAEESSSQAVRESTAAAINGETQKAAEETKKSEETTKAVSETRETSSEAESIPEPQTLEDAVTLGTVIPCSGTLQIIRSGDHGEGIVFHAKPQFDAATAPGNVTRKEGSYPVDGKIYVLAEDGKPYLMYKTGDYYVTSNETYVSYIPDEEGKGMANREWIREYADDAGVYVTIYALDDNHVVFDTGAETSSGKRNVLEETVATFIRSNLAEFTYIADDGTQHTGAIQFWNVEGKDDVYEAVISYESPIWYPGGTGSVTEIKVYN
ncbi:MAG TPA: hypothetical protein IAB48_09980 [Candidatus Fimimorpha excrementavium]|nr:hypothetical protein [Candidatus Fimimorpha excrementavium]